MKNYVMTPFEVEEPLTINDSTLDELATLLESGMLEASDLSDDLVDSVIDYQFNN